MKPVTGQYGSMSVKTAERYFELADDPDAGPAEIAALYAADATLMSPREGVFHGRDEVQQFFELNAVFFERGAHHIEQYHVDGDTVVCEGWIEGRTAAGRSYEGVGLTDIMEFNGADEIQQLRVYLDYSAILTEVPDEVPDFRD
ncbi:MAG: ketosteroid isomerase-related protein [halophilic archaeon J07HX5]|nr:MAG: ketosteroid isomerase-related protein [halophilic archaeon J07HX5]